ncbi:MAG: DEAD/DEAH box helicase family protein [Pontiellaceae bacterium]|jgi:superfamily II DNA or RNA helicase|nr:DEAD/DEAH box helicase family protein [Pontiellaceae bacterium]
MPIKSKAEQDETQFPSLKFRFDWRPYQKRVLEAIEHHLSDQRLHVVAAPGAGKTVLGLEIFRRLEKHTFILSPTRIIRDQWLQRLTDFCDTDDPLSMDWVSNRLNNPQILTSITYQALHSKSRIDEEIDSDENEDDDETETETVDAAFVLEIFKQHRVQVIILDEAHHLRTEWWKVLDQLCEAIPELIIVALTATPPYDSKAPEWKRYTELCGPIDEEISVPELVKAGTLCPHQDYIWAVDVSPSERQRIKVYDDQVKQLLNHLVNDETFCTCVLEHPWLDEEPDEAGVYNDPQAAMALLIFLKHKTGNPAPKLCAILDISGKDIPALTRTWWQILLEHLLLRGSVKQSASALAYYDELKKRLRSLELLRKNELSIMRSRRLERSLALSGQKANACLLIHKLEIKQRGDDLRQVILTDYIRDEALSMANSLGTSTLGAWPVFKTLCEKSSIPASVAMLTGRMSIVHETLVESLTMATEEHKLVFTPFDPLPGYVKVSGPLNLLTNSFTSLLIKGRIKTLVGTGALLGEGWDAPAVNSLILASSVGTYMLTNQMRGRAIRIDRSTPEKISSIWHLVALDAKSDSGLGDFYELKRRFEIFVGLSERNLNIESGFERMKASGLEPGPAGLGINACFANNRQMISRFHNIATVSERWKKALASDLNSRIVPSVETENLPRFRSFQLRNTLGHLLFLLMNALGCWLSWGEVYARQKGPFFAIFIVTGIGTAWMVLSRFRETLSVLRICLRHLPVDGALRQIGEALCRALCEAGMIETPFRRLHIHAVCAWDKSYYLSLSGGTYYESSLFADGLAELLGPIDNPRYLVIREGNFLGRKRDDYHAVPFRLAAKKELAEIFYRAWVRHVGPSDLIYTRSEEGRAALIHAQARAFTAAFKEQTRRLDRWQ